ncbi:MAG: DUF4349 domain-containing protein [Sediminibacterium sp.]|nr:DUF4349 domain-containing protein [Sediminibacterium sp.]
MKYCFFVAAMLWMFTSCKQVGGKNTDSSSEAVATENAADSVETQIAALSDGKPGNRKFIRTAELSFRVNDVQQKATTIEGIVKSASGFVVYQHLSNQVNEQSVTELSRDSSLETIHYTVQDEITVRVPTANFDTVLRQITQLAVFLDDQIVQSDDVSFQVLSNHMTIRRAASGTKKQRTESAELAGYQQEEADRAKVDNLSLTDRMKYSDIRLKFTQRPLVKHRVIANYNDTKKYEPGFGRKFMNALTDGWSLVEWIFLLLIKLWSLILGGLIAWFLYRKYRK